MNCIVTAGPTYETLDHVRRLTNFSTGRLGTELANFLVERGHDVTLLLGEQATYAGERRVQRLETFSTTADLSEWLLAQTGAGVDAIFHAAAVSDFKFGKIWERTSEGELVEVKSAKISTRMGPLLAELVPTQKIIAGLRDWFPKARLIGWKYAAEGDRASAIEAAVKQVRECLTDACVANGAAYGEGFGVVRPNGRCAHFPDLPELFQSLHELICS